MSRLEVELRIILTMNLVKMVVQSRKAEMQAVNICLLAVILNTVSCMKYGQKPFENINVIKLKASSENYAYLTLASFESEDLTNSLPGGYIVNGVVISTSNQPYVLNVKPDDFIIEAGAVGKEWRKLNIKVAKGDSLILNFFLKQEDTDFINYH